MSGHLVDADSINELVKNCKYEVRGNAYKSIEMQLFHVLCSNLLVFSTSLVALLTHLN